MRVWKAAYVFEHKEAWSKKLGITALKDSEGNLKHAIHQKRNALKEEKHYFDTKKLDQRRKALVNAL